MVYYIHHFGRSEDSSVSSPRSSRSSRSSRSDSSSHEMSHSDPSHEYEFGKRSQKSSNMMGRVICCMKLGVLAGLLMMFLAYLSVTLLNMDMFRVEDPVSRKKLINWQKIAIYSGVVFLAVSILSYLYTANK